jgi:rare lipoprotein A
MMIAGLGGCARNLAGLPQEGLASWYGDELRGRPTASGERFNPDGFTAAHRAIPFGTCVRVEHRATGLHVEVTINDRGPFAGQRIIDLSRAAARRIGLGAVGRVRLEACR